MGSADFKSVVGRVAPVLGGFDSHTFPPNYVWEIQEVMAGRSDAWTIPVQASFSSPLALVSI